MQAYTPLDGLELAKPETLSSVPALGNGARGFVFLCVFVVNVEVLGSFVLVLRSRRLSGGSFGAFRHPSQATGSQYYFALHFSSGSGLYRNVFGIPATEADAAGFPCACAYLLDELSRGLKVRGARRYGERSCLLWHQKEPPETR